MSNSSLKVSGLIAALKHVDNPQLRHSLVHTVMKSRHIHVVDNRGSVIRGKRAAQTGCQNSQLPREHKNTITTLRSLISAYTLLSLADSVTQHRNKADYSAHTMQHMKPTLPPASSKLTIKLLSSSSTVLYK